MPWSGRGAGEPPLTIPLRGGGAPKTIDNDLSGTDFPFGFDTAVSIATDAIDRIHTTAESHNRVMVVEVMGRNAGWIATFSGIAGGAKFAEKPGTDPQLIVQETKTDEFGHVRLGGISQLLAGEIEKRTRFETRWVVLGHIQRGGSPTAHDRVLATRFGIFATEMVHRGEVGKMAALQGNRIVAAPLAEATAQIKTVDMGLYA